MTLTVGLALCCGHSVSAIPWVGAVEWEATVVCVWGRGGLQWSGGTTVEWGATVEWGGYSGVGYTVEWGATVELGGGYSGVGATVEWGDTVE